MRSAGAFGNDRNTAQLKPYMNDGATVRMPEFSMNNRLQATDDATRPFSRGDAARQTLITPMISIRAI